MGTIASIGLDTQRWTQAQQQLIDNPIDILPQQVTLSSRHRPWKGLAVWVQQGPVEDLYIPAMNQHCVVLRRGPATHMTHCIGGQVLRGEWRPGEAVLVPAGLPSFWRSESSRDNLHINLSPAWLAQAAGTDPRLGIALRPQFGVRDPVLWHFGELLLSSLQSNASLTAAFAERMALTLAAHLVEHHCEASAPTRRVGSLTQRQVAAISDAVRADLATEWTLDRLAGLAQLSPFHFARAFKTTTGETPHRHVMRLRLEQARHEVVTTTRPLIEVAMDTGFVSVSHFSQAFRGHWGISPGQLRRGP